MSRSRRVHSAHPRGTFSHHNYSFFLINIKIWNVITSEYTPVGVVDDLFALPSPVAVVSLLFKYPKFRLLPLFGLTLLVQLLVLVSILAPNAFLISQDISTPKLNFAAMPTNNDPTWWEEVVAHYTVNDPFESWNVPADCGDSCAFQITYQAPGISCREMSEQETGLIPFSPQLFESGEAWCAYRAGAYLDVVWGAPIDPLNISFVPMVGQFSNDRPVSVNQTGPFQGQLCEWRDKTFQADFTYKDSQKSGTVKAISDTNDMAQHCSWTSGGDLSHECSQYASAAANFTKGYIKGFNGGLCWTSNRTLTTWDSSIVSQFLSYSFDDENHTMTLSPIPDASQKIERFFAKAVLGTLMQIGQTDSGFTVVNVRSAWVYYPLRLWAIYGPALLLGLLAGLYGFRSARISGIVREKKFSSFLVATRTKDLDAVVAQHSDAVMSTKLRHDAQTGRFLVLDDDNIGKPSVSGEYLIF